MRILIKIIFIFFLSGSFCVSLDLKWDLVYAYFNYNVPMESIDNLDENNIMLIGNDLGRYKTIFKSTDAGLSWDIIYKDTLRHVSPLPASGKRIQYKSKDFCIISCDEGKYFKTTDGGETWKEYDTGMTEDFAGFMCLSMYDENHGVMASLYHIIVSHDGFETYEEVPVPGGYYIWDIAMVSPYTIHCLSRHLDGSPTYDVKFYTSKDGGQNWTEYYHGDYRVPKRMQFLDSLIGYNLGQVNTGIGDNRADVIYKTTDGGETWTKIMDTVKFPSNGVQELDIYDDYNAIYVGQFGKIWRTTDGGKTFLFDSVPEIVKLIPPTMATIMLTPETSIICDFNGRIYRSSKTTGITEIVLPSANISVSPNPATDYIEVALSNHTLKGVVESVRVYDVLGVCVITSPPDPLHSGEGSKLRLDVSTLPSGVYFVQSGNKVQCFVKM